MLSSGHTFSFPPRALTVPGQANLGPGARGTLEGTFTIIEGGEKAELQRLRAELAALKGGGKQLAQLSFRLHGSSLAAEDRNLSLSNLSLSKNSSDPYYILQTRDPITGSQRKLGRSNTVRRELSPSWDVVEVRVEQLPHTGAQQLTLEVYDQDQIGSDDLIGVTTLELPDLQALVAQIGRASCRERV